MSITVVGDRQLSLKPLVAVLVAVCLLAGAAILWRHHDSNAGPLAGNTSSSISYYVYPRVPFANVVTAVQNSGDQPATVEAVRLVSPTGGIRLLGSWLLDGPYPYNVNSRHFKPVPGLQPLGAVPPGATRQIVLKLEVPTNGDFTTQGVEIDYSVGDTQYQDVYPDLMRVCSPPQEHSPCPEQPIGRGGETG